MKKGKISFVENPDGQVLDSDFIWFDRDGFEDVSLTKNLQFQAIMHPARARKNSDVTIYYILSL